MRFRTPIRPLLLAVPIVAISGVAGVGHSIGLLRGGDREAAGPPVARVVRVDPRDRFIMTVPGRTNRRARNTLIECEVENISVPSLTSSTGGSSRGGSRSRGAAPAGLKLISLLPEGTLARAGDVLAEIDASEFIEIARLQRIKVEQSRAAESQARLDLEGAQIALAEYLDGVRPQTMMQMEGQIAMAQSQLQLQRDHREWTDRVLPLGYVALAAVRDELITILQAEQALVLAEQSLHNYANYSQPKLVRQLEARLEQSRASHLFAVRRRELDEERLEVAERQLERCTIRAPHDGQVIYCATRDGSPIREGIDVYRGMDLLVLPDLGRPVVDAQVIQTRIWMVATGMDARVRVDARPGPVFRGRVVSVSPFPDSRDTNAQATGVIRYDVRVELELMPGEPPLMPGLSSRVEILVPAHPEAMTIPSEALSVVDRETVCYVLAPSGVERRVVEARPGSTERLQVIEGLAEGEQVILGPHDRSPGAARSPSASSPSGEPQADDA